jgi:phage-related protein
MKIVEWLGTSRVDLRDFPDPIQSELGLQLFYLQQGQRPDDWKPMSIIGQGVEEMRVRDEAGAFRVIYYARRADKVYVLHAFQKKTQQTALHDMRLAKTRFLEIED